MSSLQHRLERCCPSVVSFWASLPVTGVTLAMPVRDTILAPVWWSENELFQTFKKCHSRRATTQSRRHWRRRLQALFPPLGAIGGAIYKRHWRCRLQVMFPLSGASPGAVCSVVPPSRASPGAICRHHWKRHLQRRL